MLQQYALAKSTQAGVSRPAGAGRRVISTHDLDEAVQVVSDVYCEHKIVPCGAAGSLEAQLKVAQVGSFPIVSLSYATPVIVDAGRFPSLLLMMSASSGAASVDQNEWTASWRSGQTMPLSPDRDTVLSFDRAFSQTSLRIDLGRLEQYCASWLGHPLERPIAFELQPLSEAFEPVWQDAIRMLSSLIETGTQVPVNAANSLEEFLLSLILHGHRHNYSDELAGRAETTEPRVVAEAKQLFLARAETGTTMSDVAKELGVSLRSLQLSFQKAEQTTPFAYWRKVRLEAARRILTTDPSVNSVMEVALRLGFTHVGRFAAEYKAAFEETPAVTLRRHRHVR